ncbi:MAG: polysaccharide biosynthesis protein [Dorea sp.]|nr:polysaccharide biosynthesis protein [Dorea sp.]
MKKNLKNGIDNSIFKGRTLLITGGTGSFGNAVLKIFLETDIEEIRIFSRDEKKQDDMRHEYQTEYPQYFSKLKFYIGDVRDIQSIRNAVYGVDYIFHAAALKQVPSCEFFPVEAVKTNVLGTENVLTAAIEAGVKKIICLSTDKAAYPVNAMGTSKAMMEKVIVAKTRTVSPKRTSICCTRYGNVMCSRGSVIPLFISQLKQGLPMTITEPAMTRFIMSLDEAVELVLFAFGYAQSGDIMVQKAPACTIDVLARAVSELFCHKHNVKIIGIRHGEKMYETLLTEEECAHAVDLGHFFRVPCDRRDLNYDKYFKEGNMKRTELTAFTSDNTEILDIGQVKTRLLELPYIQKELRNWRY